MNKYKVTYRFVGEVEIEAESKSDAISSFNDRVGVSDDDLYDNVEHKAIITDVSIDGVSI